MKNASSLSLFEFQVPRRDDVPTLRGAPTPWGSGQEQTLILDTNDRSVGELLSGVVDLEYETADGEMRIERMTVLMRRKLKDGRQRLFLRRCPMPAWAGR